MPDRALVSLVTVSAVEIRPIRPDDFAAVGELTVAAYRPFIVEGGTYEAKLRDPSVRAAQAQVFVASLGGAIAGTVTYCPEPGPFQEIARPGEAEFRMLAVAPSVQGAGVGAALCRHLADTARAAGFSRLVCSTQRDMRAAQRLYERVGFGRRPERDWSPAPNVQLLAFTLELR
jgi:ribosomal protein S18 acetylase RimI-like enzyme